MDIGKLSNEDLESLILSKYKKVRNETENLPHIGADCAKLHLGDTVIVSSDPITAAEDRIGYLTVHINCNDAAAACAEPVAMVVTLLAPPHTTKKQISDVADDIAKAAVEANIDIIGGHTEITDAVTRIVTSSTVLAKPISHCEGKMRVGDDIIMTKSAGLEGCAVIVHDHADKLSLSDEEKQTAIRMIDSISVVKEGVIAAKMGVHAMHDITEGGILGAVWEMAYLSGIGCRIDMTKIPITYVAKKICSQLSLNPYRLLSSGSMLIACENGNKLVNELEREGIVATVIGKATETGIIDSDGNIIAPPGADELYKVV